jgi:hypothetical protein
MEFQYNKLPIYFHYFTQAKYIVILTKQLSDKEFIRSISIIRIMK